VAVNTRDIRWPPDAHDGGSSHPGVFGSVRESSLACPEPLAVDAAAGAGTTTNVARVTDIRLDNLTTTLLGPNLNSAATPTHLRELCAELSLSSPVSSLLQLVTHEEEGEVLSTLPAKCLMQGFSCSCDSMLHDITKFIKPTSDWRSPNHILEVTIHHVCYPMTESVIHTVFSQYGKVEQVHVLEASDQAFARVVFYSKQDAADAFGELHGRYMYNGCCLLDIEWGSFLDRVVNWDVRYCNTTSNSSLDMLQTSTTSTISMEVVVEKDMVVGATTTINVDFDVIDDEMPTTYSRLGLDINTCVNQTAATFFLVEAVPEHVLASEDCTHASLPKMVASIDISVDVSSTCSEEGRAFDIGIQVSQNSTEAALTSYPISELIVVHPGRRMPSSLSSSLTWPLSSLCIPSSTCVDGIILQIFNASVPYDVVVLLALSMRCVEWKPESPLMQLGISGDIAGMRPTPWPSYDDEVSMVVGTIYNVSLFLMDKGLCVEPMFDRVMIFSMEDCRILIMVQLKQDGDAYSSRYISEDGGTYNSNDLFLLKSWHQFNCHSEGQLIQCYWTLFFLNCHRLLGCTHEFLVVFYVVAAINQINDGVIISFGAASPDIKELKCSGNYIIETVAYRMKNILENKLSDPFEVNKMAETL
jgi:hypothetical protein